MKKIDPTVLKETAYVAAFTLIFSAIMQSVYLIIGKWDYTVILGNLLGATAAVSNFLIMGISVQNALGKEEKDAKNIMKLSQSMRLLMLFIFALVGYLVPVFNIVAVVIPFIFPRIAVTLRGMFIKKNNT